mgnify:FL=1
MSLYGRTDSATNVTKAGRGIAASSQAKTVVFVDETEAALEVNKNRGINAPGWWSYFTYTDSSGKTRHKAEHLVTLANADLNANETQADDAIAADVLNVITISADPADTSVVEGATATFSVTASVTTGTGTIAYQWQRRADGGNWTNISGATSASYTTPALTVADNNGDAYRALLTTDTGADEVTSATANLTVTV